MDSLWFAVGFLTTLPVPTHTLAGDGFRRAGLWFPLVGLGIGALLAGAAWAAGWRFPPAVTAVLVVVLWAALTGALRLDGLADCGDGLPSSRACGGCTKMSLAERLRLHGFSFSQAVTDAVLAAAGEITMACRALCGSRTRVGRMGRIRCMRRQGRLPATLVL